MKKFIPWESCMNLKISFLVSINDYTYMEAYPSAPLENGSYSFLEATPKMI